MPGTVDSTFVHRIIADNPIQQFIQIFYICISQFCISGLPAGTISLDRPVQGNQCGLGYNHNKAILISKLMPQPGFKGATHSIILAMQTHHNRKRLIAVPVGLGYIDQILSVNAVGVREMIEIHANSIVVNLLAQEICTCSTCTATLVLEDKRTDLVSGLRYGVIIGGIIYCYLGNSALRCEDGLSSLSID